MVTRIDEITPEQLALTGEHAALWSSVALNTAPCDRPMAEAAIREAYRVSGLALPPRGVTWVANPFVGAMAYPVAASLLESGKPLPENPTVAEFRDVISASWHQFLGGQFWVGYYWGSPAVVSFFQDKMGLELPPETEACARANQELARQCCWVWPHREFAMACERPYTIKVVDGVLHCEDGPAVAWEGYGIYAVQGVTVPEWIIERPGDITAASIDAEQNAEVRRIMMDRYGIARYVADGGWSVVDESLDPLGNPRRLLGKDGMLLVEMTNSTVDADGSKRIYHVFVHPELRPLPDPEDPEGTLGEPQELTAHNAIASTFGVRGEDYHPDVET
jgi:hypothetical protein